MDTGSGSLPTLWATMEASTPSAVSVSLMTRSVFESQWPLKLPPWMMPVTCRLGGLLDLQVFHLALEDQAVHGVALGSGLFADVVRGQGDGVALPLGGQGLAVGRELAANAVGIGKEEGRAEAIGRDRRWSCPAR
jgi:hypothetical protein